MKINNSINYDYKLKSQNTTIFSKNSTVYTSGDLNKIDMSLCDTDMIDYDSLTKLTLNNLSKSYKDINIYIVNKNDNNNIKELAIGLGNGKYLVVSQEFIDKMSSSAQSYNNGKAILEETLKQLSNNKFDFKSTGAYVDEKGITFWNTYENNNILNNNNDSFLDAMKKMQGQVDELKNKFKVTNTNSVLNAPIETYTKLARAKTISEVKGVVSNARYNISKLKSMLRDCEDNEKSKIRAAIKQLEKAITRSYRKVSDLSQEKNLVHEKCTAEVNQKKKLAEHKKNELNRRRAIRYIRERAQIDEANPLYYYPQMLLNKNNNEFKEEPIPTIDISSMSGYSVPQVSEITVNVSSTVNISI